MKIISCMFLIIFLLLFACTQKDSGNPEIIGLARNYFQAYQVGDFKKLFEEYTYRPTTSFGWSIKEVEIVQNVFKWNGKELNRVVKIYENDKEALYELQLIDGSSTIKSNLIFKNKD